MNPFPLTPALELMRAFWALNHALERTSKNMEKHLGITAQQRMVLRLVGRFPGIAAGDLARLLQVDPGTLSAALKRLVARSLLVRKQDKDDGRKVLLVLSPAGKRLDRPSSKTFEAAVERLLKRVSSKDASAAHDTLRALVAELEAPRKAGAK